MKKLACILFVMAVAVFFATPALANHQPADKVAAAASSIEKIRCKTGDPGLGVPGCTDTPNIGTGATILEANLKLSHPTDLIFYVTAECALWTATKTTSQDGTVTTSSSTAKVVFWVEVDGKPVKSGLPVDTGAVLLDQETAGKVVFCERQQTVKLTNFNDNDVILELFLRTRAAHGFNWICINPLTDDVCFTTAGAATNPLNIKVKASIHFEGSGTNDAAAAIGRRTLIVEPVKLANDATL